MYTLEIKGRAIAIVDRSKYEALDWFLGEVFEADLYCLGDASGKPLWDGEAERVVRKSQKSEAAIFNRSYHKSLEEEPDDSERDDWVAFLLPIVDLSSDDDEDDCIDDFPFKASPGTHEVDEGKSVQKP